jgi:hypothetical protein
MAKLRYDKKYAEKSKTGPDTEAYISLATHLHPPNALK